MKKKLAILATFCISFAYGQNISEYQYIVIPEKFTGFIKENYKLDQTLTKILKSKKYSILSENKNELQEMTYKNPCNILNADILDDSTWLKNKVIVQFKDCNNKIISEFKGYSSIKEYEEGFQDALTTSLITLPTSRPKNHEVQKSVTKEIIPQETAIVSSSKNNTATKYLNNKKSYQRIILNKNEFILSDSTSSQPFASFKNTSKDNIYLVKLADDTYTIGYFDQNNIIIDIPQSNGSYSKEIFFVEK